MAKTKSMSLGLLRASGWTLLAAGWIAGASGAAQGAENLCPVGGFDVCFPNVNDGAPNAACNPLEAGATSITACLSSICSSEAAEPEPGFFSYCCASGGSERYDDFCVFSVQNACSAVAEHCADRCPPLDLLLGTVTLAPPPSACIATYPAFIARICNSDPFCCTTSWDTLCAADAREASRR